MVSPVARAALARSRLGVQVLTYSHQSATRINNPAPRGGVFREETVSHSRVASERDVGLADASKVRRKRRGMRPEEIQLTGTGGRSTSELVPTKWTSHTPAWSRVKGALCGSSDARREPQRVAGRRCPKAVSTRSATGAGVRSGRPGR